jgi:NAD(P) transhydrogenase subunit beta
MEYILLQIAYLVASILFILSLKGLSSQETAQRGNLYGMIGMIIALIATLGNSSVVQYSVLAFAIGFGGFIGWWKAKQVEMTAMPELVALLHSFVGAAAVLVGFASDRSMGVEGGHPASGLYASEIAVDVFIGALTLTGSIVAYLKLQGKASSKPVLPPKRHQVNLGITLTSIALIVMYAMGAMGKDGTGSLFLLTSVTALSGYLGYRLVMAVGGADMPVVVSMLNSYSGWTASAAGFMLNNDLLIITGALVGSSGAILSYIMCKSMNRSIVSVIFGGFGAEPATPPAQDQADQPREPLTVQEIEGLELAQVLTESSSVVIVPGYGMAQARASNSVYTLCKDLQARGVEVRFAIHPVAGRLPGHMNILLAEANVPYDIVLELEDINDDLPETDVVLVVGANDIVNPLAQEDPTCPIGGMEVLEVWKSNMTVIFKRSRNVGYAGIDNPLFYKDNSKMFFGDAAASVDSIIDSLKTL